MEAEAENQSAVLDLEGGSEWRFELENEEDIAVRVSTRVPSEMWRRRAWARVDRDQTGGKRSWV